MVWYLKNTVPLMNVIASSAGSKLSSKLKMQELWILRRFECRFSDAMSS